MLTRFDGVRTTPQVVWLRPRRFARDTQWRARSREACTGVDTDRAALVGAAMQPTPSTAELALHLYLNAEGRIVQIGDIEEGVERKPLPPGETESGSDSCLPVRCC